MDEQLNLLSDHDGALCKQSKPEGGTEGGTMSTAFSEVELSIFSDISPASAFSSEKSSNSIAASTVGSFRLVGSLVTKG